MTDASIVATRWEVAAVEALMRPRSIAIVGVSTRPGSAGHMVLANLTQAEFRGDIHLVGRNVTDVEGRPCLASIDALPENVDLAVLTVPAGAVAEAVAACVRRRVKSALTFASGFAEMGEDAHARPRAIGALAEQGRLALVGPNCLGYTNYVDGLCIGFMSFPRVKRLDPVAGPGVAVVAQSGGMGGHVIGALEARAVPVSYSITVGNEAGIGLAEFIAHLARDPSTGIILAYGEQIRRPVRFLAAVAAARAPTTAAGGVRKSLAAAPARGPAPPPATMRQCAPRSRAPASCSSKRSRKWSMSGRFCCAIPFRRPKAPAS